MKTPEYYKRFLPHIQPIGDSFFITTRLSGSLPISSFKSLQEWKNQAITNIRKERGSDADYCKEEITKVQKRYFQRFDEQMDKAAFGPTFLAESTIAKLVASKFHEYDGHFYNLIAYTIMPNHIHFLIDRSNIIEKSEYLQLDEIMKRIKGGSAFAANQLLGRHGRFWQRESYDHRVRNEREFYNIIRYIANNPVKAGLVRHWKDWEFTYIAENYLDTFIDES